jgi:peptidoglycan/LPS O-acetylase OafA/YrhL
MTAQGELAGQRRPALDGIRAVAVLAVIAYHVGGRYRGGFLGVDVFFVLSGYLITGLLLSERVRTDGINLPAFWYRRARRLLPALLIVVVTTAVVVSQSASVADYAARRDDLLSTIFYYANWHFIAVDTNYFAATSDVSPLRHMWSLAIEEQFYLAWPLIVIGLLLLTRGRRHLLVALVGLLTVVSAVLMAALYDPAYPSRAYFGTATHASGLLTGAALAILLAGRPRLRDDPRAQTVARWAWPPVVLALAAFLVVLDDEGAFYYRGGALIFALLTAIGIWVVESVPRSLPARALSLASVAWVGVISYGLYLWHWPLLVWIGDPSGAGSRATQLEVVVLTFVVAAASFYLVERPIRTGHAPWIRTSRLRFAAVIAGAVALAAATSVWATQIDPSDRVAAQVDDLSEVPCPDSRPWCEFVEPVGAKPTIATAGDSTSLALTPGLRELAQRRGWGYVQAGHGGCSVVPAAFVGDPGDQALREQGRDCVGFARKNVDDVDGAYHPDVWIVWDRFLLNPIVQDDGSTVAYGTRRHDELVTAGLRETIKRMTARGGQVVVLGVPPSGQPVDCADEHTAECDDIAHTAADPKVGHLNEVLRRAVEPLRPRAVFVPLTDVFCPGEQPCRLLDGETLLRYDGVHLTSAYSKLIAPTLIARSQRAGLTLGDR